MSDSYTMDLAIAVQEQTDRLCEQLGRIEALLRSGTSQRPLHGAAPRTNGGKPKVKPVEGPPCEECGSAMWWDNRHRKANGQFSAKAPDMACARKKDEDGNYCPGRIWNADEIEELF